MANENATKPFGSITGNLFVRLAKDPKIQTRSSTDGGSSYDLASALAVCSPFIGVNKEPETIWCMLYFPSNSTKLVKNLKKGDRIYVIASSIRPNVWKTQDGKEMVQLDVQVSRDWNSVVPAGNNGGGSNNSNDNETNQAKTSNDSINSNNFSFNDDEDDIPF